MQGPEKSLGGNELNDKNELSEHEGTDPLAQRNRECKGPEAGDPWVEQMSTKDQCDQSPVSRRQGCLQWRLRVGQQPRI